MQRAKFSLASVLWLFAASAALAQTNDVSPNGAGVVSLEDDFSGTASLGQGAYIDVRTMTGSGVGYRNGYTQVGGFVPLWGSDNWFIAPQARLIITDTQRIGGNVGAVYRHYNSDWDRIFGGNLFFDFDESYLSNRYQQVGFGFETLGQWWDARGNVYLPTGGQTNNMGPAGLDSSLYYIQNLLAVRGYDLIEQSLKGGDVEFGVPVFASTPWLRAYAGAYFYQGDGHDPVGVRARVDANVSNDLLIGMNVTHDNTFGTNLNAVVDFRFSGFLPTRYFPQWTTQERMLTQVQRNWRITTDRYLIAKDIPVVNPRDDQPYFVVHVDSNNTGAGTGDGTAENPYHNLPGTVPTQTDLVLVQRGQSTQAAPYTGNIQLVDYARLLGEGKAHVFDGYVNYGPYSHTYDNAVLPGFSDSGLYPFLSNPAGDIVTLANHNEVSALVLQNASGRGIYGNGVSGFSLNNLEISGNAGGGIVLQNAVGSGGVTLDGQTINGGLITDINRNVVGGYTPPAIGVGNNAAGGIVIDTGAAGLTLGIARVSMNAAAPGTQTVGVQLTADDGNLSALLNDVQARGNTTAGIVLNQTGSTTLNAGMTTIDVSANQGDGLQVNGNGGTTVVGTTLAPITGLLADDNAGRGIAISGSNAAQIGVALSGGSTQRSGDDGLFITGTGAGTVVDVSVTGNSLVDSGQNVAGAAAVDLSALAGANVSLTMNNTAANFTGANNDYGLQVTANAGTATATITNGNFNGAGVDAVNILGTALGTANVDLTNTGGNNAGNDGIHAVADNGIVNLEVTGSSAALVGFNNAGVNGFDGLAQNAGTLNACLEYATFNGSGDIGMKLLADGAGSKAVFNLDHVQVNGSNLTGLSGTGTNSGELDLRAVNSQFNTNDLGGASDGVLITANNSGRALTLFSQSSANGNSQNGYNFQADTAGYLSTRLDRITATGNGAYGVNLNAAGVGTSAYLISEGVNTVSGNTLGNYNLTFTNSGAGSSAVAALTGSFNNNAAGDGVNINMNGAATALVSLTGNGTTDTIDNNAGNGVNISIQNASQAGVSVSGYTSISNNGTGLVGDGIHVELLNVTTAAAVDLRGIPTTLTTMTDNHDDGVEVDLTNVVLGTVSGSLGNVDVLSLTANDPLNVCLPIPTTVALNTVVNVPTANGVLIDSYNITNTNPPNPGQVGILVTASGVSGAGGITISNNVDPNMEDGIRVEMTNNSTPAFITIDNNTLSDMTQRGIFVTADSGSTTLNITNNSVSRPGDSGIVVDLSGTANYTAHIDNNSVDGASLGVTPTLGLNFLGSTINDTVGFIPPDTMGGVGINHIVEMLNGVFAIYDKSTGAQISSQSLNNFWDNVVGVTRAGNTFDSRVIYDPSVNRWFVISEDGNNTNNIYVAVSDTADPTGGWHGTQFLTDTTNNIRFGDYPTFSVNADSVVIATNNFGGPSGFDVSIFTIPKADLLGPTPSVVNMTRFEAQNPALYGYSIQAAVDLAGSAGDPVHLIGGSDFSAASLQAATINNVGGPGATLSGATSVAITPYVTGPNARQPGGTPPLESDSRIGANVVKVGNDLWAVHSVTGSSGNSAIAWYEIDATTNTVVQSGVIENPNVDYIYPSIAVNPGGAVVIGFTGSGPSQNPASMLVSGLTTGGVTSFGTPIVTAPGAGTYFVDFGSGRNRWGDYSATVVDPVNPNKFWTFQERAAATDTWGVQITSLTLNNPVSGTANDGIRLSLNDSAQLSGINTISSNTVSGVGNDGIAVHMNDNSTLSTLNMVANSSQNNGNRGIAFDTEGTNIAGNQRITGALNITGAGTASGNAVDGIQVNLNQVLGTPNVTIDGHTVANNSGAGIVLNAVGTPLGAVNVSNNTATGNLGGDGVLLNLTGAATVVASATVDGNTLSGNSGNGLNLTLDNGANLVSLGIANNTINGNFQNGIDFQIGNTLAATLGATTLTANNVTGHVAGDGFRLVDPNAAAPMNLVFTGNVFNGNTGGRGVDFQLGSSPTQNLTALMTNNAMDSNGQEGLFLGLTNDAIANISLLSSATANTLNGQTNTDISSNGSAGVRISSAGTSNYTLSMGGTGTLNHVDSNGSEGLNIEMVGTSTGTSTIDRTTFDGNVDAGIGLRLNGALGNAATINVTRSTMRNTTNGGDPDFNGEGFMTILRGASTVTGSLASSTITSNASDGIRFDARGNNVGTFTQVNNFTIGGATAADGNTITGNTGNGISVLRTADAEINNMQILHNTVTGNTNGLYILAANANKLDTYTANFNSFSTNRQDGILIDERADADVRLDMDQNLISSNSGNGVHLIEQVNAPSDTRSLTGTWTRNVIDSNNQNGIRLSGVTSNLLIGDVSNVALGNDISLNTRSGVNVDGAGSLTIGSNLIEANGTLANLGTANEDAGVYLNVAPVSNITVVNNDIVNNNGDGLQYGISTGFNGSTASVTINLNDISNNAGRGIDLINRGSNLTNATITNNTINSNGLEGVYIVNTSSTTQNQFASSTTALAADGSVFADPRLRLLVSNNEVRANGLNSPSSTTGLYLRVGTSDGGGGTGDTGGFASAGGFTTNPFAAGFSRGGVIASVFSNNFGGNFGDDIKFASFVSTGNPATSGGTWGTTTDPTAITAYQSDPLARLDLYFNSNTYDSVDVNNTTGVSTGQQTNVAFYNNAEGTFKSRVNSANAPFQGPFTSDTRRRNAQRQAGFFPPPGNTPAGSTFLYSGVGASTFRVNTTDFNFFVDDTFPYFGAFLPGSITGESAYSWGTLP